MSASAALPEIPSVREQVSEEEWQQRVDLAALYRLVAMHGWDDFLFTHLSARVPGPEHHFLINPFGMLFEEVTASSLVKVDVDAQEKIAQMCGIRAMPTFQFFKDGKKVDELMGADVRTLHSKVTALV